jgi:NAD(P)H-binding
LTGTCVLPQSRLARVLPFADWPKARATGETGRLENHSIPDVGSTLGMELLVVGATGALDRDVISAALDRGHRIAALVREPTSAELPGAVELVGGDVLDAASLTAPVGEARRGGLRPGHI